MSPTATARLASGGGRWTEMATANYWSIRARRAPDPEWTVWSANQVYNQTRDLPAAGRAGCLGDRDHRAPPQRSHRSPGRVHRDGAGDRPPRPSPTPDRPDSRPPHTGAGPDPDPDPAPRPTRPLRRPPRPRRSRRRRRTGPGPVLTVPAAPTAPDVPKVKPGAKGGAKTVTVSGRHRASPARPGHLLRGGRLHGEAGQAEGRGSQETVSVSERSLTLKLRAGHLQGRRAGEERRGLGAPERRVEGGHAPLTPRLHPRRSLPRPPAGHSPAHPPSQDARVTSSVHGRSDVASGGAGGGEVGPSPPGGATEQPEVLQLRAAVGDLPGRRVAVEAGEQRGPGRGVPVRPAAYDEVELRGVGHAVLGGDHPRVGADQRPVCSPSRTTARGRAASNESTVTSSSVSRQVGAQVTTSEAGPRARPRHVVPGADVRSATPAVSTRCASGRARAPPASGPSCQATASGRCATSPPAVQDRCANSQSSPP